MTSSISKSLGKFASEFDAIAMFFHRHLSIFYWLVAKLTGKVSWISRRNVPDGDGHFRFRKQLALLCHVTYTYAKILPRGQNYKDVDKDV